MRRDFGAHRGFVVGGKGKVADMRTSAMSKKQGKSRRALRARAACAVAVAILPALALGASAPAATASAPAVYTGGVSGLTAYSVVVHGGVNPKGETTGYVFQYGASGYSAQTPLFFA